MHATDATASPPRSLTHRLRYTASHMANLFLAHAFSPLIREGADMCGILSGHRPRVPDGSVSETSRCSTAQSRTPVASRSRSMGREGPRAGDILMVNDYTASGTHFNDACTSALLLRGQLLGAITVKTAKYRRHR